LEAVELIDDKHDEEIEIDLKALFLEICNKWYILVVGLLVGVLIALAYETFISVPMYQSSSLVYMRGTSKTISLQDLQLGEALTQDYEILFTSRPNMEKVLSELNLDYSVSQLQSMISITNPSDSRMLQVTVTSTDPNLSKDIANEVVSFGIDNVREIDSQEPYLVEKAIANNNKIGSSIYKIASIGGIVGLFIAFGLIFIRFILSDNIKSIEDVERVLELPVLSVVVEDRTLAYAKKKSSKKKLR
jgi:capsular polysaccharide biosynthesis protein